MCTPAIEAHAAHSHELLHGKERSVQGDSSYTGVENRLKIIEAQARGELRKRIEWNIALTRSRIKAMPNGPLGD